MMFLPPCSHALENKRCSYESQRGSCQLIPRNRKQTNFLPLTNPTVIQISCSHATENIQCAFQKDHDFRATYSPANYVPLTNPTVSRFSCCHAKENTRLSCGHCAHLFLVPSFHHMLPSGSQSENPAGQFHRLAPKHQLPPFPGQPNVTS